MNDSELQVLIQHLAVASKRSAARSIAQLRASDDPAVLIAAALFDPAPNTTLARARQVARTTRDRQLVAISAAHLAGQRDRVDALIREHLVDHPDHPIVTWIAANGATLEHRSQRGFQLRCLARAGSAMNSRCSHRFVAGFVAGLVALVALGAGVVWAETGTSASPTSVAHSANPRAIDFNDPTTLAWSVQLPGGFRDRLHDVTCWRTTGQSFECRGAAWNGMQRSVIATVSIDGASWSSQ